MISFPLSLILIPFAVMALIIAFLSFMNLRNLARYRAEDVISFTAVFVFLAGIAVIIYISYGYLAGIDWTKMIEAGLPSAKIIF